MLWLFKFVTLPYLWDSGPFIGYELGKDCPENTRHRCSMGAAIFVWHLVVHCPTCCNLDHVWCTPRPCTRSANQSAVFGGVSLFLFHGAWFNIHVYLVAHVVVGDYSNGRGLKEDLRDKCPNMGDASKISSGNSGNGDFWLVNSWVTSGWQLTGARV